MQLRDQIREKSESECDKRELLDRRISEAERAAIFSRTFLEKLWVEDWELKERAEEIALSYERELDRLRSMKGRSGYPEGH